MRALASKLPERDSKAVRRGLTLVELLVVLVILIALASLLIPMVGNITQDSKRTVTNASLQNLATILHRYRSDNGILPRPGYVGIHANGRVDAPQLRYLFFNPGSPTQTDSNAETGNVTYNPFTKLGWNGPYVMGGNGLYTVNTSKGFTTTFGMGTVITPPTAQDPCILDGWLNPIVLVQFTNPAGSTSYWLQSAGPDGILAPVPAGTTGPPTPAPSGSGSIFPNSSAPATVDDITLVIP